MESEEGVLEVRLSAEDLRLSWNGTSGRPNVGQDFGMGFASQRCEHHVPSLYKR